MLDMGLDTWVVCDRVMPLRPFILESYFDAFAQGLPRTSSLASPEHFADLKQETSIAPFTIRQERQITCLLYDLPVSAMACLKSLRSLRPQCISHRNGGQLRSINTMVQPCDASGATFLCTLVYSSSLKELLQKLVG